MLQYDGQQPIYMVGVDNAAIFQLGRDGFSAFAGRTGFDQGSVNAKAVQVPSEYCGLYRF